MKTVEKQVLKILSDNELYLNSDLTTLEEVADYIDTMNEDDDKVYYSPEDWFVDTKTNYPEYLINKQELNNKYYEPILSYLATQRELCIDQTGCEPSFTDIEGAMDCEEFDMMLKAHELDSEHCGIKTIDLFNYLLDYWNKH